MDNKTNPSENSESSLPSCEVFRVGTHTTSSGECLSYSAADLDQIVASYDPVNAPAPIVVGHPKADAPAYGWIKSFKRVGDKLVAEAENVNPEFAALVKNKAYRKISMAFFRPDETSNPKPGIWYPRHWGFLGAAAPAVPGLQPVAWSSDEGVEFSYSLNSYRFGRLFQRLRDFFIDQFGLEKADDVISEFDIADFFEQSGADRAEVNGNNDSIFNASGADGGLSRLSSADKNKPAPTPFIVPNFSAQEKNEMSEQDKQELERLRTENAKLQQDQQAAAREARRTEFAALAENLKAEGKLPAAEALGVIEFALSLPDDSAIEFAAADGKKINSVQWFKNFLSRLPKAISVEEAAPTSKNIPKTTTFSAPIGAVIPAEQLEQYNKIVAYATEHKVDFITALAAVEGQGQ
ncbi:MAG: hypothetical protein LBE32_00480 [Burkholderiales bacterium]|jgi:hypothetical protein|nr:hypothetical protein [Burkholderiales bacterium]